MSIEGMPERFGMGPGKIYITTADGTTAFEGIKEAAFTCSDQFQNWSKEYWDAVWGNFEFTARARIDKDSLAKIAGFKNYNCYSRSIRRMKRRKEQERRRRLKEDSKNIADRRCI